MMHTKLVVFFIFAEAMKRKIAHRKIVALFHFLFSW